MCICVRIWVLVETTDQLCATAAVRERETGRRVERCTRVHSMHLSIAQGRVECFALRAPRWPSFSFLPSPTPLTSQQLVEPRAVSARLLLSAVHPSVRYTTPFGAERSQPGGGSRWRSGRVLVPTIVVII